MYEHRFICQTVPGPVGREPDPHPRSASAASATSARWKSASPRFTTGLSAIPTTTPAALARGRASTSPKLSVILPSRRPF